MIGTLINVVTVLVGGTLGSLLGARLPERMRETVMHGVGLVTLVLGTSMAIGTNSVIVVLLSICLGGILGEWWRIEDGLDSLGKWLEAKASRVSFLARGDFVRGFVTASLVFCVGPMTILGSIQDGLTGDYTLLAVKSVLDLFAGLAFSASMGMGVTFSALTVLLFQGGLSLGAAPFQSILTDAMITEMSATGGVMILGIGFLLLGIKRIKVGNFLPALVIAPLLTAAWEMWGLAA